MARRQIDTKELLNNVIDVIGEQGFHGSTLLDFAKAASVDRDTLRRHFEDQDNLMDVAYQAVLEQTSDPTKLLGLLSEKRAPVDVRSTAQKLLRVWYQQLGRSSAKLLFQAYMSGEKKRSDAYRSYKQLIESLSRALPKQKKTSRNFDPSLAATNIVMALVHMKLTMGDEFVDSTIDAWWGQLYPSE